MRTLMILFVLGTCLPLRAEGERLAGPEQIDDAVLTPLGSWPSVPKKMVISTDGRHCLAIFHSDADAETANFDGHPQPACDEVGGIGISGAHFAYAARTGKQWAVCVDGKPGPACDKIEKPLPGFFSPDGSHVVYAAVTGQKSMLVVDGKSRAEYGGSPSETESIGTAAMSDDGHRMAWTVVRGFGTVVVDDGKPQASYERTNWDISITPVLSPDGRHLAYAARSPKTGHEFVVLDGKPGREHSDVRPPIFSPDSKHLAYVAKDDDWCVVEDEQPGPAFWAVEQLNFSPDGKHLAYVARTRDATYCVVKDNVIGPQCVAAYHAIFSPDGKQLAYAAVDGPTWTVSVNDVRGPLQKGRKKGMAFFSPDSKRVAYGGGDGRKRVLLVDGQTMGPQCDVLEDASVKFSSDSRHVAWVAGDGKSSCVYMDGKPGPTFDSIVVNGPAFVTGDHLEYLGVKHGMLYRVTGSAK